MIIINDRMNDFSWFLWALAITLSNVIFSIVVFYHLQKQKKLHKNLHDLRKISLFYSVGMMFALISAVLLLFVSLLKI